MFHPQIVYPAWYELLEDATVARVACFVDLDPEKGPPTAVTTLDQSEGGVGRECALLAVQSSTLLLTLVIN